MRPGINNTPQSQSLICSSSGLNSFIKATVFNQYGLPRGNDDDSSWSSMELGADKAAGIC